LETYKERKARGRLEVVGGGADRSNQSRGVKKLCEGLVYHGALRGWMMMMMKMLLKILFKTFPGCE